jgi:hypothetical protein
MAGRKIKLRRKGINLRALIVSSLPAEECYTNHSPGTLDLVFEF